MPWSAGEVLTAIISSYFLAFVQAGVSVFNEIENWPIMKSLLCHFALLYITYVSCYLINSWIPFDVGIVGIFTAIFVVTYLAIWLTVYLLVRNLGKKMNSMIS